MTARAPVSSPIRSRVEPRGISAIKAARRLGLTLELFRAKLPELRGRGFPAPDPTTGMYDLKKIDLWMDGPDGSTGASEARDAREVVNGRLARM
jgi:hypothetical protein